MWGWRGSREKWSIIVEWDSMCFIIFVICKRRGLWSIVADLGLRGVQNEISFEFYFVLRAKGFNHEYFIMYIFYFKSSILHILRVNCISITKIVIVVL